MLHFKSHIQCILFSVLILASINSKAASCCAGGGGQSICILSSEQKYQFGMASSYREIAGHFDPYGNYSASGSGNSTSTLTTVFGGAYRIGEDWQFALNLPFVNNQKEFSNIKSSASGLGDPTIEGRFLLWEDLNFLTYRPALTFYGGISLPFGKSIYTSKEASEVDVTGDGYSTMHVGANAAKLFRPVNFVIDASYYYPMSKNVSEMHGSPVDSYTIRAGNKFQIVESATYLFSEKLSSGIGFKQAWQFESTVNNSAVAGSASRIVSNIVSLNYFHDLSTSFSFSYETPAVFEQYLANQPQSQTISLAISYGGL